MDGERKMNIYRLRHQLWVFFGSVNGLNSRTLAKIDLDGIYDRVITYTNRTRQRDNETEIMGIVRDLCWLTNFKDFSTVVCTKDIFNR